MLKILKLLYGISILGLCFTATSCSDFLEVNPSSELPTPNAVTNVKEAQSALNGVYTGLRVRYYYGTDMITYADVKGDDMGTRVSAARTYSPYTFGHATALTSTNGGYFWEYIYSRLVRANSLLTFIDNGSAKLTSEAEQPTLNNIKGEALALRALMHFDLVRIYGEPYLKNKTAPGVVIADRVIASDEKKQRSTVEQTYDFILQDLKTALGQENNTVLLSKTFKNGAIFNYWAAKALLSRVYLYMGDYENAYIQAVDVIKNGGYSLITNEAYVNSWSMEFTSESIFEVWSSTTENADREGIGYVISPSGYSATIVTEEYKALLKSDTNDVRIKLLSDYTVSSQVVSFITKKYPGRGGNIYVNNTRVIRLSDIYLIAAESGVHTGKSDASTYLNAIRKRANPAVADVTATLDLVEKERRKELVGEGQRFFDITRNLGTRTIKRPGTISLPLTRPDQVQEISWDNKQTYLLVLPIPQAEIDVNPKIYQNSGY